MAADRSDLIQTAGRWRDADPDPQTRDQLAHLIDDGQLPELSALFDRPLQFGTAGLRGPLGPGPARMNRLICALAAAATSRVLLSEVPDGSQRGVVVAHDARHGSAEFAAQVAQVTAAHGIRTWTIDGPAPTPLAAFAVRHLGAAAGFVVTASHNPAEDNGLKVYWADGAQIIAPIDEAIAAQITLLADDLPSSAPDVFSPPASDPAAFESLGSVAGTAPLVVDYLAALAALPGIAGTQPSSPPPLVAYSAMHGVGAELLTQALGSTDVARLALVDQQRDPDPDFPTVRVPNPEEPGAMDAVIDLAQHVRADAAIANDPDADRVAIAILDRSQRWRTLTGDETGALLAWHLLWNTQAIPDRLVVTTIVSSRLLAAMATAAGVHFEETLTGFKHLSRPALGHPEWYQLLAYEEALGYAIGPDMRDKDGIAAATALCCALGSLAHRGSSVEDLLDDLARSHGAHVTANGSIRFAGDQAADRFELVTQELRDHPPRELAGVSVSSVDRPAAEVTRLFLVDDTRVVLRPSGTEAKFKYYCEAIEPVASDEPVEAARHRATSRLEPVVSAIESLLS